MRSFRDVWAANLKRDQQITVLFPANGAKAVGHVELIAPVTDAESGTVRVKLRVDNSVGRIRSGERCQILLAD